ncbi:helicase C-terminal domain-containing protein [Angustibacter luteus]|uniref:Helicase C-terminal domain-containing protein n=1 Tax=Angustibacter luteus TaxID=658456 RepID=A0ABW1JBX8_9ACTN
MATRPAAAPRSLADELRSWDDARLVALLRARPDVMTPLPNDLTTVAARCTTRASVHRVLDSLDTFELQVLDALAALPDPASRTDVARLLGVRPTSLAATLDRLRDLALVWGRDAALRLVLTVRDTLGPFPAGLGPPSPTAPDGAEVDALLAQAPEGAREVLDRLVWQSPVGAVRGADRPTSRTTARSPVEWLLAHRLLAVLDPDHVVLPREVGLHLRGGRVHRDVQPEPPAIAASERAPRLVDAAAGGAASDLLRLVAELGELWGVTPPPVLRSGGLGVRDLRRTAAALDLPEPAAAVVIELAYAAGLVADDGQVGASWAPTPAYDAWTSEPPAGRWRRIAGAWLGMSRVPELVGQRDDRDTVRAALSADVDRAPAASVRQSVLAVLAELPTGSAPDVETLLSRLRWRRPRRTGSLAEQLARWTVQEAELLGVTGRGALSAAGRALLAGDDDEVEQVVAALLPAPVDHVLLQADLTAVAPGPLEVDLGRLMHLAADVESRGGATVYRFTPDSVRRALDSGWAAEQLLAELGEASRTPVPQPLEYLVRDVARRHGRIRVGAAKSFVRSDDESVLRELMADRRAAPLSLRALAPSVLAAQAEPATVLQVLRSMGLAPAAESATGEVVVRRPDARRTPLRQPPAPTRGEVTPAADPLLQAVVRALRSAAPPAPAPAGPALAPTEPTHTLAVLREAIERRQRVWIGYADGTGRVERRVVEPLSVEGGRVTAFDHSREEVRSFSVHRVTGVAPASVDESRPGGHPDR